jgi:uncharacterized protein
MIRVDIVNVFLTAKGDEFIVLLKGAGDERTLPISIGQLEAQSIAIHLYHVSFPRPLTHDLFKSVLERFEGKVSKVVIGDLIDNTFYARLFCENKEGASVEIDSRPSDAIALALRFGAPVFVEEKVMDESGVVLPDEKTATAGMQNTKDAMPDESSSLDALKAGLAKAIREERYEEAAKLRDEINKLTKSN